MIQDIYFNGPTTIAPAESADEAAQEYPGWWADDGNASIHYPDAESADEAAQEYVSDGDWPASDTTQWVRVHVWRETGLGEERDWHTLTIPIEPLEPDCAPDSAGHRWIEIDVQCSGGGAVITDQCAHCSVERTIDSWAQDPDTGEQGLRAVTYSAA